MKKLFTFCSSLNLLLLSITPAQASVWVDPDFAKMVKQSDLIVMGQVTKGGMWKATVKPQRVLKGKQPKTTLTVTGFNNRHWPRHAVQKESLQKGEKLLLFLRKQSISKKDKAGKTSTSWIWYVPTPSTGDYRIKKGKLHGDWYRTSYPHFKLGADATLVLDLIEGYIQHKAGQSPKKALQRLKRALNQQACQKALKSKSPDDNRALYWLLWAQGRYGKAPKDKTIACAAKSNDMGLQHAAAVALRTATNKKNALPLLLHLLKAKSGYAQSEATRTIIFGAFPAKKIVPHLLNALPTSSLRGRSPRGIMDPLRNTFASSRELMIRALTKYNVDKPARSLLIGLLKDKGLTSGVFQALRDHFLRFPNKQAHTRFLSLYKRSPAHSMRLFHTYLLREKSKSSLAAVYKKIVHGRMRTYDRASALKQLGRMLPPKNPTLTRIARKLCSTYHSSPYVLNECVGVLIREQTASSLSIASKKLLTAPLRAYDRGQLFLLYATKAFAFPKKRRRLILSALKKYAYTQSNSHIFTACIVVASPDISRTLSKLQPNKLKEKYNKTLLQIVQRAVKIKRMWSKRHVYMAKAKELEAWLSLMKQEASIGFATLVLLDELKRVVPKGQRRQVAKRLRQVYKGYLSKDKLLAIQSLGGSLTAQERKRIR